MLLENLSFKWKLGLFASMVIGLFFLRASLFANLLEQIQINGVIYNRIVQLKQLETDLVTPTICVVEPMLLVMQMENENDADDLELLKERYRKNRKAFDEASARLLGDLPDSTLRSKLATSVIPSAEKFFRKVEESFLPSVTTSSHDEKLEALVRGPLTDIYTDHLKSVDEATAEFRRMIVETEAQAAVSVADRKFWLGIVGYGMIACLLLGSVIVAISISLPTERLIERVRDMAEGEGDLTKRIDVRSRDEIGKLGHGINMMIQRIHDLVSRSREASVQLFATTTQISATAREQESTMQSLSASTSEIAAAVREISATSHELSDTMSAVHEGAQSAREKAFAGREGLVTMADTMHRLAESTGTISARLSVVREKASDITSVVTTITKVADQTNLLSINAAIEAEKAGESGRGFLVVAREIRRLADQTAVATLEIESMVRQMQAAVSAGVMEMDKFSQDVRGGVGRVTEIGGQISQVIENVATLNDRFNLVNEGMRQQSVGARQIDEAMVNLVGGVSQTSASLKEFNAATASLRSAAETLKEEISRFKLSR